MPLFLKTLLFTIVAPGTVTVLLPYLLLHSRLPGGPGFLGIASPVGGCLIALGFAIYLWCARDFAVRGGGTPAPIDAPRELVVAGLYRFVRNPMYVGILTILLGEVVFFDSAKLAAYALCVWLTFHLFVVLYEEPHLRQVFGESYVAYCGRVSRWLPRPPRSRDHSPAV